MEGDRRGAPTGSRCASSASVQRAGLVKIATDFVGLYWLLIRASSGVIRRDLLRGVAHRPEAVSQ